MQLGIHLPHAGEQATPALIRRFAVRTEALGLSDVWVSEHIIVPRATFPRSPLFYDPVPTLTWVAVEADAGPPALRGHPHRTSASIAPPAAGW